MNNAQFDHLLQATAPRLESPSGSARSRDAGPPFDNLFRQASEASTSAAQTPPLSSPSAAATSSSGNSASTSTSATTTDSQSDDRPTSTPLAAVSRNDSAAEATVSELADADNTDNSENTSDEPQESAEVVALLAAEQASQAKVVDTPAVAVEDLAVAIDQAAAADADDAGRDSKTETTDIKSKADISPAENDVTPVESSDKLKDIESQADNSLATLEAAAAKSKQDAVNEQATGSEETAATDQVEPGPQQKSEEQPQRNSERATAPTAPQSTEHASAQPAAKVASAALAAASAKAAPSVERVDSPKSEKNSTARTDSTARDAANAPTERPANIPRIAEPSTGTAIAASVQQPPAIDPSNAAATNTSVKTTGGATESKPGILSSLNRLDRSSAPGARGAGRPGQTESGPQVDPARFISRVARAVQTAQERGGPLQLRLSPPELGAMRLELSMNQGALTATIETDNSNAKQLLLDNLPALRDRLADQNIKIERFDVDVRRDPSGNQQNYAPQDRDRQQRHNSSTALEAARRQSAAAALDDPQPLHRTISNTSINVVA